MKKILFVLFISSTILLSLFGQERDDRRVLFGENYQNIIEITKDDKQIIINNYDTILKIAIKKFPYGSGQEITDCRIFEESCKPYTFYRFVFGKKKITTDYIKSTLKVTSYYSDTEFEQLLFVESNGKLYLINAEPIITGSCGDGTVHSSQTVVLSNTSIVRINDTIIRVILFSTTERRDEYDDVETDSHTMAETGSGSASIILMDDIINEIKNIKTNPSTVIELNADNFKNKTLVSCCRTLIDDTRPFMYTIQNAFDGSPDTSFVENTEDDLITMEMVFPKKIKTLFLINGFAKNDTLYRSNNRIKNLIINDQDFLIKDEMSKVFTDYTLKVSAGNITIDSSEIYKGVNCSDTCIAEIDWL